MSVYYFFLLCVIFVVHPNHVICSQTYNDTECPKITPGSASSTFTAALKYFAGEQCNVYSDVHPKSEVNDHEEFDLLIVGAGTAGCIVARRLVDQNFNVLLLEAGSDPPVEAKIPNLVTSIYKTKYDWQYSTVNNGRTSQALINGNTYWPRGKMLGGSHQLNMMFYYKGAAHDYKSWEELGNNEWSEQNIKKFFKKAESLQSQKLLNNNEIKNFYGLDGLQVINTVNFTYDHIIDKVLESFQEIGIENKEDINTANLSGSSRSTVTAADGNRKTTYAMYVEPIISRKNFKLISQSYVTKILINDMKANGVAVNIDGKNMTFNAKLEVILSAGSINTPHLLMLSGVGDKKHLESKNIKCKVDLPAVGQNLQDHAAVGIPIMLDLPPATSERDTNFDVIKYLYNRTGYLAQSSVTDIGAFYSHNKHLSYPEFQNVLSIVNNPLRLSFLSYKDVMMKSLIQQAQNRSTYVFEVVLLHPYSRGSITLNSSNPYDYPIIDANYFGEARDLKLITQGIKILTKIIKTDYFKSNNAFLPRLKWPDCDKFKLDSANYWKCIANNTVTTIYHPVGTSSMGPDPKKFVVDQRLRVQQINNLRIIDASIMPNITSCNTNGPTIMIAERGSDFIIKDHLKYKN
ncbi:ecdysone oxidase-like [Leptidea sinapis]|uniref:ecdysone oxidase-like n=1 Tax=Leptidea sinapis TaxID=189913 RepID=UPI002137026F|nr:ecdysone oxidase-like [Leptidea sinapis]